MNISEQAVFKWVVIVALAGASVIAVTLLTRPLVGALWGLVLVVWGCWHALHWAREKRGGGEGGD
ncbi:MAG: hypothetical protein ACM3NV_08480 [Syntrophothermus sp.]